MTKKLVFVHTMPALVGLFTELAQEILDDDVEVWHIADEVLLRAVLAAGGLTPFVHHRVAEHAMAAEQAGADVVQLTCSSISPCADIAQALVDIPVLKVDEPMVDQALSLGRRIGVAATVSTTLKPTSELVRTRAAALGKQVEVETMLCEGAYTALRAGDLETHDRLVRATVLELSSRNEVVVLAQASMARALEALGPAEKSVPILSSPRLAIERAKAVLSRKG
ncbi:MAG: aspartate/glutamate racemase family protein [Anaerolineae bacterium]|nr:aspartate/glutamate racemase family protein [Anaerolineae bacterium]MDW8100491.1 aspartate/glutamate racemase family protein [Anaerolineae bacterium]